MAVRITFSFMHAYGYVIHIVFYVYYREVQTISCSEYHTLACSLCNREFCGMVRKIFIYTKEDVQRMDPKRLNPKGEESSLAAEGVNARETKNLPPLSIPEDA